MQVVVEYWRGGLEVRSTLDIKNTLKLGFYRNFQGNFGKLAIWVHLIYSLISFTCELKL